MNKQTTAKNEGASNIHKAAHAREKAALETVETILPTGSWQRVAVGVAAAAGGGLLAAAAVGVGPAAIAGAAGYLAYRGLSGKKKSDEVGFGSHKH